LGVGFTGIEPAFTLPHGALIPVKLATTGFHSNAILIETNTRGGWLPIM